MEFEASLQYLLMAAQFSQVDIIPKREGSTGWLALPAPPPPLCRIILSFGPTYRPPPGTKFLSIHRFCINADFKSFVHGSFKTATTGLFMLTISASCTIGMKKRSNFTPQSSFLESEINLFKFSMLVLWISLSKKRTKPAYFACCYWFIFRTTTTSPVLLACSGSMLTKKDSMPRFFIILIFKWSHEAENRVFFP